MLLKWQLATNSTTEYTALEPPLTPLTKLHAVEATYIYNIYNVWNEVGDRVRHHNGSVRNNYLRH